MAITGIRDEKWREHYLKLLHNGNETKTTTYTTEEYNAVTLTDVMKILNNTKNRKASGIDNIPMELWKRGDKALYIGLERLFNDMWAQAKISSDWRASLLIPTHKTEDKIVCSDYRGFHS
jgi:hypothetical protein